MARLHCRLSFASRSDRVGQLPGNDLDYHLIRVRKAETRMKLYRNAPQAATAMVHDPELVAKIEGAIKEYAVDVAIETGTFEGTGTGMESGVLHPR